MAAKLAFARRRRGRGRSSRRPLVSEINVTPMVDVMLVLLIIFMVTAVQLTAGVDVQLPKAQAQSLPPEKEPLTVSVQADGKVYLQDTPMEVGELLPRLAAIAETGYDRRIFVRGDARAPYGRVAEVMALMNRAGYRNLGLVTDSPKAAPAKAVQAPAEKE